MNQDLNPCMSRDCDDHAMPIGYCHRHGILMENKQDASVLEMLVRKVNEGNAALFELIDYAGQVEITEGGFKPWKECTDFYPKFLYRVKQVGGTDGTRVTGTAGICADARGEGGNT